MTELLSETQCWMLYKVWPVYLSAVQDILTVCDCLNCCSTDIESNINQYGNSCNSWGSTSNQPPVWWSPDCWLSNEAAEWRRLRWWYVVAGHCYQYTTTMTTLYIIPTGKVNGRNLLFVQITSFYFTWRLFIFSKTFSTSNTEVSPVSSPPRNSSGRPGEVPPEDEQLWSTSINDVILYHWAAVVISIWVVLNVNFWRTRVDLKIQHEISFFLLLDVML